MPLFYEVERDRIVSAGFNYLSLLVCDRKLTKLVDDLSWKLLRTRVRPPPPPFFKGLDMKRVIISDLHIGSKYANDEGLISFLSSLDCDELILAGDIIDFIKIPSFTPKAHSLFKIMHNFNRRIVYIIGNHDISFEGLDGKSAFGVLFTKKYSFVDSGKRYKVEHGHTGNFL